MVWSDLSATDINFLRGCPRKITYYGGRKQSCSGTRKKTAATAAKLQRLRLVHIVVMDASERDYKQAQVTLTDAGRAALAASKSA